MLKKPATIFCFVLVLATLFASARQREPTDAANEGEEFYPFDKNNAAFDTVGQQPVVVVREIPGHQLDSLKRADDFWYASLPPPKSEAVTPTKTTAQKTFFQQQWFRQVLWVVVLASFIGVVISYLVSSNILLFKKRAKNLSPAGVVEEEETIFNRDYSAEILLAEGAGDYRQAVRLWYLRLLKNLSEKGLLHYRYGQTNQDYVQQLAGTAQYRDFFRLTRSFEYTWYGQFALSAEAYAMLRTDFTTFQNGLLA